MPETILIVDDEQAIASLTSLWMGCAGYQTLLAHDGKSGIGMALLHRPNLILLDIRMPDLDGFEVHRQLKAAPELASIPVIFLSAHAQEATRQDAAALGAGFLSKPYDRDKLILMVRAVLRTTRHNSLAVSTIHAPDCLTF